MEGFFARISRIEVSAELLCKVAQMHAALPAETRPSLETHAGAIFELLAGKGVPAGKMGALATAIDFRLTALARLEQTAALRGWSMPGAGGAVSIPFVVLKAAAEEPLIEDGEGQAGFDPQGFQRRLLAIADPGGQA